MFFLNDEHKKTYETVEDIASDEYRAALYLIATDRQSWAVWKQTGDVSKAVQRLGVLGDLARNLFNGGGRKKVSALEICRLDSRLFRVAIEAMKIRHGDQ